MGRNVKERISSKFSPFVLPLFTPKLTLLALHAFFIAPIIIIISFISLTTVN